MDLKKYEFIMVREYEIKNRKTPQYEIWNKKSGYIVGRISWYSPWRQFCFTPYNSIWSSDCLEDVQDAIKNAEEARLLKRNNEIIKKDGG